MATIIKKTASRRNPLGAPPKPEDARGNLHEPESAPATVNPQRPSTKKVVTEKIDGRTLRRTGRTVQFTTRIHPDTKKDLHEIAKATKKHYNVILEESLALYKKQVVGK